MSRMINPNASLEKAISVIHTDNAWFDNMQCQDWETNVTHLLANNLYFGNPHKVWVEEYFCKNKILRGTDEIPDTETHVISLFIIDDKIFAVIFIPIPNGDEQDDEEDAQLSFVLYGAGDMKEEMEFFEQDENFIKLMSVPPEI